MSFSIHKSYVALCNNERVIIYNLKNHTENMVNLPDLESNKKINVHNNVDIETYHMITSVTFSEDGRYFAVCTNRKQLCLYETKDLKLLSNRTLARAASRVRFTSNNDIVVADKAGDAYLFSTSSPMENGVLLLGHMSMLLDVLITQDMKYILTTDRDEKIRVSTFPNCYNIVSYCLGHAKFVTNISELPHKNTILVSSGGDGVFKLWDYKQGTELMSVNFCDRISKCDIAKFNQDLRDYNCDEVDMLPVKHLRVSSLSTTQSLVIISFYSSEELLAYNVISNNEILKANYLESIAVGAEPIECLLHERYLWILTDVGLQIYKLQGVNFVSCTLETLYLVIEHLNKCWETLRSTVVKQNLFPILYKRIYDNVQEKRKKVRLANNKE